jgi:DUF1009 family protein
MSTNGPFLSPATSVANQQPKRFGIVAGWGRYPELVAETLQGQGHEVYIAALRNHANPELADYAKKMQWFGIGKLGGQQKFFQANSVDVVLLAGKLFKTKILYSRLGWLRHLPDVECLRAVGSNIVLKKKDTRDDTILTAIVQSFLNRGIHIVGGTELAPSLLAERGLLTKRQPSERVIRDLQYGWRIAKQSGLMDIGQSVTVRDGTALAIEAIEGTDGCIERTGTLCPRGGWSLVKVAKPNQDPRFDLPTIGLQTVENVHRCGGNAIAIEAHQTIIVDREVVLNYANRHGITIVSWAPSDVPNAEE